MPATLNDIQAKYGESVYPLYKDTLQDPYMEKAGGKGYVGTVLYDEKRDLVMCPICGKWRTAIGKHLQNSTDIKHNKFKNLSEVKKYYGINKNVAMCSRSLSQKLSASAKKNLTFQETMGGRNNFITMSYEMRMSAIKKSHESRNEYWYKNKRGLCEAQIIKRIEIVRKIVGRTPCDIDLRKYDRSLQKHFEYKYGSANKGLKRYGFEASNDRFKNRKYSDEFLIAQLRLFVIEKHKIPTRYKLSKSSFPKIETYVSHFGSWRRAKMMAGLDQLLEEVKNGST